MYAIISGGKVLVLSEKPRYIKKHETTGVYVEAQKPEAIGIAVNGRLYNIRGGNAIPGAPEAVAVEGDIAGYVFRNREKITENETAANAAIAEVEDALCDMDMAAEERIAAMEDALCELDSSMNGGEGE